MSYFNLDNLTVDIINRIMNCKGLSTLFSNDEKLFDGRLYPKIRHFGYQCEKDLPEYLEVLHIRDKKGTIKGYERCFDAENTVIIAELDNDYEVPSYIKRQSQKYVYKNKVYYIKCKELSLENNLSIPDSFRVLAVIHFYNEIDVIEKTTRYLLEQGIDVCLVDNWSDDGSYDVGRKLNFEFPNRVFIERFPSDHSNDYYRWYDQLERTEQICRERNYDWYIHYDADEIRISPWENANLREALFYVDFLGYNCVENTVIDFRITDEGDDIFAKDGYFEFRKEPLWCDQLKTWKKCNDFDLKRKGGHTVSIEQPKVFPLKFLNRHYPLRNISQGLKKVLQDRIPRFEYEKRKRGWHTHYTNIKDKRDLLYKKSELIKWESSTFRELYFQLFMECGLLWNDRNIALSVPDIIDKRVILWGGGDFGRYTYLQMTKSNEVILWCDKNYERLPYIYCEEIVSPYMIKETQFDYVFVTVFGEDNQKEIFNKLTEFGVRKRKIYFITKQGDGCEEQKYCFVSL